MPQANEVRFSIERADRAQGFIEKICRHTKGIYAGKPFILAPWQRDEIVRPLFGSVRYDEQFDEWVRLYRLVWLELARKNGKSELLAAIALLLLVGDDEQGAEIYGAAKDTDQAFVVFRVAKRMVELSPVLDKRLRIYETNKRIVDPRTDSFYRVIPADAEGNLGQDPHGVVFDEIIAQPNRELWDALKTGQGSRRQPLMVAATTSGNNPASFAKVEHDFSEKVSEDPELAPSRFVFMRNTPEDADPFDERNWAHANPALGDFLSVQTLRDEAIEARNDPQKENAFRQYRLNQWVEQVTRWIPVKTYDSCVDEELADETILKGKPAWGGIDLASSVDMAALCWDFPDPPFREEPKKRRRRRDAEDGQEPEITDDRTHRAIWRFWLPEARLKDLDRRTGGQGSVWVNEGALELTEGEVIDYKAILRQIDEDARAFDVQSVAYDPWGMTQLHQILEEGGLETEEFRQGFATMSPATKEWERLITARLWKAAPNPVMRFMFNNIAIRRDPAGNIKIDRDKSGDRVDGPITTVMSLGLALTATPKRSRKLATFS